MKIDNNPITAINSSRRTYSRMHPGQNGPIQSLFEPFAIKLLLCFFKIKKFHEEFQF